MSGRSKVPLAQGHSMMDWNRLGTSGKDLKGVKGASRSLKITLAELRLHATPDDAWMAIRGLVYNVTPYINFHPGGGPELMRAAGADGTYLFDEAHRWVGVEGIMQHCLIGTLVEDKAVAKTSLRTNNTNGNNNSLSSTMRPPVTFCSCTIEAVTVHTHDTYILDIALADPVSLDMGQHIRLRTTGIDGRGVVIREYTPIAPLPAGPTRSVKLLVKLYPEGSMSQVLQVLINRFQKEQEEKKSKPATDENKNASSSSPSTASPSLPIAFPSSPSVASTLPSSPSSTPSLSISLQPPPSLSTSINVLPPLPASSRSVSVTVFPPLGSVSVPRAPLLALGCSGAMGLFSYAQARPHAKLGIVAAGTGLAPFYRIAEHFLSEHKPENLSVFTVNKTEDDVLGVTLLEEWQKAGSKVFSLLTRAPLSGWNGLSGRISKELVAQVLPPPGDVLVLICGPPGFGNLVAKFLVQLGYTESMFYVFA